MTSSASAFQFYFHVVDTTTKTYSFTLKGFQNSGANPTTNSANSIISEIVTAEEESMTKNTNNVMVTPSMELETTMISDMQISQDNFFDG